MWLLLGLSGLAILMMVGPFLGLKRFLNIAFFVGLLGLFLLSCSALPSPKLPMLAEDHLSHVLLRVIFAVAMLISLMGMSRRLQTVSEFSKNALICFSLVGAVLMLQATHAVMLFLGLELLSIPLYVLAGSLRENAKSQEAGMKYFLLGAFASAVMLFGLALLFAETGTLNFEGITAFILVKKGAVQGYFYAGILLVLAGLLFKVGAAPFQFWVPDVYEGAPTRYTAFMAVVVKVTAFAALYRVFFGYFSLSNCTSLLVAASLGSLIWGHLLALKQSNIKRLLAYSSIAHTGYLLFPLIAKSAVSAVLLHYYFLAYALSSLGLFLCVLILENNEGHADFKGLFQRNKLLGLLAIFSLLSLAGIPPLGGFIAKYVLFVVALKAGYLGLVIVGLLGAVLGVYYYLRLIPEILEESKAGKLNLTWIETLLAFGLCVGGILLGAFTGLLI